MPPLSTDYKQQQDFLSSIRAELPIGLLEIAIDWIAANLTPSQVFSERELLDYASDGYSCDEVFKQADLEDWAENNGYIKE